MTVGELIAQLSKMDLDLEVWVGEGENNWHNMLYSIRVRQPSKHSEFKIVSSDPNMVGRTNMYSKPVLMLSGKNGITGQRWSGR